MCEEKVRNFSLIDLVQWAKVSKRLANGVARAQQEGRMPFQTVGEYLDAGSSAFEKMVRIENIGHKSASEFEALIESFTQAPVDALAHVNSPPSTDYENLLVKRVTLEDFLLGSLENLTGRQRHVIIDRYGMKGTTRKTLEAVGKQHNLKRERIRQIELRAVRKLKGDSESVMKSYVKNKQQEIYEKLAEGKHVIPFKQLSKQEAALPGEYRLALDVAYGSVKRWLQDVAQSTSLGWCLFSFTPGDINAWKKRIDKYCKDISLPCPIANTIEPLRLTRNQIEVALEFMQDYKIFSDYLFRGNITPRKMRCARLHQLMSCAFEKEAVLIEQALHKYHTYYPSDLCSARDLSITLRASPHLFVNLSESGWTSIGGARSTLVPKGEGRVETGNYSLPVTSAKSSSGKESLFQILHKIIENEGPMSFLTAKNRFIEIAGSKYSPNSVFPTLVMNVAFARMAPGIFGTKSQLEALDPLRSVSTLLLRKIQCRIYVLARAACQPRIEYPLWTPAMERAWCRWADNQAEKTLFQSLLSVVEPKTWPVPGVESRWWSSRKEKEGRYRLGSAPLGLCKKVPDPDGLYAVLLYTRAKRKINWMVANRIIGCRIDDRHIVSTLALLVAVKALRPIGSWQQHHEVGENIDGALMGLEKERVKKGFIEWRDFHINDMDVELNCSGTWVRQDEIRDLVHRIKSGEKRGNIVPLSRAPGEETLAELLERHRKRRVEKQLRFYMNSEDN